MFQENEEKHTSKCNIRHTLKFYIIILYVPLKNKYIMVHIHKTEFFSVILMDRTKTNI